MTVRYNALSPEAWDTLHSLYLNHYLDGECYAFAAGLQQVTEWDIVALATSEHPIRHAAARDREGNLYDVRGKVPWEAFGEPFHVSPPYSLRVVEVEDLKAVRPITRDSIRHAAQLVECLWPEFVRTHTPGFERIRRFVEDLDRLSRQHGVWIRAPFPATLPCLAIGEGDEDGYDVTPSNGNVFFIDRRFKRP